MARAKRGDRVKIHYTGKLEDGSVFDSSSERGPLEFVIGEGRIIPGLEQAVIGMNPGESKNIKIPEENAYGPYNEKIVMEVEKAFFPHNLKPEVGQQLQVPQENDNPIIVIVTKVSDTKVTLDGNHPLSGKNLTFDLQLIEII